MNKGVARPSRWFRSSLLKGSHLAARNSFVDQDFDLKPAILGSPFFGLVRCCWLVFTDRARRYDMPHRHVTLLNQVAHYCFSAVTAQFFVHGSVAGCVGKTLYLDEGTQ